MSNVSPTVEEQKPLTGLAATTRLVQVRLSHEAYRLIKREAADTDLSQGEIISALAVNHLPTNQ